ncbi:MAG: class I SAM-dependent methyltransferase [Chloroflexi bacterium]|nr:class I SAM-dependent methyltransferase [Chloroflexota bacterium]
MPNIVPLSPQGWTDYALLDSGEGAKLERFGKYILVRPDKGIFWPRALPAKRWQDVDAVFEQPESGEGYWVQKRSVPERWLMRYGDLAFWAKLTPFRHTGVFPEQAPQWDWIAKQIRAAHQPVNVLNLFAYTGIATLAAAAAGANVTHVDASRPTLAWARENAIAAGLQDRPIRWILDDALKYVRRESRRGKRYDGIIMDPPVFGRGPKGELWRFGKSFPLLLEACKQILAERPLFIVISAYAIEESSLLLYNLVSDWIKSREGHITVGELVLQDTAAQRPLSTGIYARWSREGD